MKYENFNYEVEEFCCEGGLVNDVIDTLEYISNQKSGKYSSVSVICNEDLAEDILKQVCTLNHTEDLNLCIDYIDFDKSDYDDAYGVTFAMENGEIHFSIEVAMGNDHYKTFEVDYLYISNEIDKNFISYQPKSGCEIDIFKLTYECEDDFEADDEFKCDGDCENCELNHDDKIEPDEEISLYDLVEDIVSDVLSEKYGL